MEKYEVDDSQLTLRLEGRLIKSSGDEPKTKKKVYNPLIENHNVYMARANDLANIIAYDKDHYSDVNIETVIYACVLAGLIEEKNGE